jgi:glycosyltransferase involved in cell wall biosynthesis
MPVNSVAESAEPQTLRATLRSADLRRTRSVLHIVATIANSDGISVAVRTTLDALQRHTSWKVALLTGRYKLPAFVESLASQRNLDMHILPVVQPFGGRLGHAFSYPPGFVGTLSRIVSSFDVVHFHGMWLYPTLIGARVVRHYKVPYVISPYGLLIPAALRRKAWKKRIALALTERRNLDAAAAILTNSSLEREAISGLRISAPIRMVPLALSFEAERALTSPRDRAPTGRNRRTVLTVGRFHPLKGIVELVDAFGRVAGRYKTWDLRIVGPDGEPGYRETVLRRVREAHLEQRVEVCGELRGEQLWDAYRAANLFVLPSHTENFGFVVVEALAAGLPVIATHGAPWSELGVVGCGWSIDISVDSLAEALATALALPHEELYAMGMRGVELVQQRYSTLGLARQMDSLYSSLLADGN